MQEGKDRARGKAAEDKLGLNDKIKDIPFEKACEEFLKWYKGERHPGSYDRHVTSSIPLKAAFSGKKLSEINAFSIEKYKLDRKAAKKADATINGN